MDDTVANDGLEQADLHERVATHETVGGYRLVQRLGEGGMGVVHLALDRQGRAVALKVLRSLTAADADARARLRREVDALGRVSSPRVAPIIDADIDGARPFVVTRWVPGPALDDVVDSEGPLTGDALHRLAVGLAEGIEAIHAASVIHRDIKPGNVLLHDGEPVLIDFGIAHLTDDVRLTGVGLVMGTPGYLAPEIVEGAPVSRATDWWGWAATLAYAASGRPPFGRGAMDAVLARVSRGEPDLSGVDPRLAPLLHAALSPRAPERPHRDEVVRALEHHARGGDVTDVMRVRPGAPPTAVLETGRTATLPQLPPHSSSPLSQSSAPSQSSAQAPKQVSTSSVAAVSRESGRPPVAPRVLSSPPVIARGPSIGPASAPPPTLSPGAAAPPRSLSTRASVPSTHPGPVSPSPAPQHQVASPHYPVPRPAAPAPAREPGQDPRIGRPMRTGTIWALLGLGVAGAAVAPTWTLIALVALTALARTVDRSMTALVLRRHERGQRPSDLAVLAATSPWHIVQGGVGAVLGLIVPVFVAVSSLFSASLVLNATVGGVDPNSFIPLGVAGLLGLVMAWWGPGGASLRRGTRSTIRGLSPQPPQQTALVIVIVLLTAALLAWGVLSQGAPTWTPAGEPTNWSTGRP